MADNKKTLFRFESLQIESVYVFDDGDFIIFGIHEKNQKSSLLYDRKSLTSKLKLNISSLSCFFDLKDNEFGLGIYYNFEINKFNNNRTDFITIQNIKVNQFETGIKLMKLLNGHILFFKFYMGTITSSIYIKSEEKEQNQTPLYQIHNQFRIENCDDILELNKNEILVYKKSLLFPESLILTILYNHNYQTKKKNTIIAEERKNDNKTIKKKLYFTTPLYKVNDKKIITGGAFNFYIIDLDTLELETTIKLDKIINSFLIRPKGNIFILTSQSQDSRNIHKDLNTINDRFFLENIKIDFATNELIQKEEWDITEKTGNYSYLYKIYNYYNNGLISLTDNNLIIYDDYGD